MQTRRNPAANRGVRILPDRIGRESAFGVAWRVQVFCPRRQRLVSKEKTLFFGSVEARDKKAAELREDRRKRMVSPTASREEIDDFRAFQKATEGTPWPVVVAGWRSWQVQTGQKTCDVTVDVAVERSLKAADKLVAAERMSPDTRRQRKHKLELFAEQFGHLRLDQVNARDVEAWIEDCDENGEEATFNNYRKHVKALFEIYVEDGTLARNTIAGVKKRDDEPGEVGILKPLEAARLFRHALHTDAFRVALGRLALEAFTGLRFGSGGRIEKADINFADRGILLPKAKLKTRKRHYIEGMPSQVWEWLAVTPDECWTLTPREYMGLKSELFEAAGVPHPHNCLRHSFATYDVAVHRNPGRTATLLCHRSQDLLWSRYKGNATEAEGVMYQAITPTTVAALLEGRASPLRERTAGAPTRSQG